MSGTDTAGAADAGVAAGAAGATGATDAPDATQPIERTAAEYFGRRADEYDSLIARCVPRYEEMLARLVDYLPASGVQRVLELGCGTGNLSLRLAERWPEAELTLVDAAPEMLELTCSRLEAQRQAREQAALAGAERRSRPSAPPQPPPSRSPPPRALLARFEDMDLPSGGFDLVTSCISLHHVADKARLYAAIAAALAPGGRFVFADQLLGGDEPNHALNWQRWLEFCRQPGHCSAPEVQSLLDHAAAHDHYTPLFEHFRLLEAAGFRALDCTWRNWIWGVITSVRS